MTWRLDGHRNQDKVDQDGPLADTEFVGDVRTLSGVRLI